MENKTIYAVTDAASAFASTAMKLNLFLARVWEGFGLRKRCWIMHGEKLKTQSTMQCLSLKEFCVTELIAEIKSPLVLIGAN